MKLIYISQGNIPSKWAHSFQAMKMAEALAKQVDSLTLLTGGGIFPSRASTLDLYEWYGVNDQLHIIRLPVHWRLHEPCFRGYRYPKFDRAAALYARLKSPELIYTRSPYAGYLCIKLKLNTIIETHMEVDNTEFRHIQSIKNNPYLIGIITISDELRELYQLEGVPRDKIFVWPDAVNLTVFKQLPNKFALRKRLGLSKDTFIVTYCGHLYKDRGIEQILECAALLPNAAFLIIGGWEKDVEKYKAELKYMTNIRFTGFIPNQHVPGYLSASDVLLMPYSATCKTVLWMSPLKLFEYMASQRPIIASDLPVLRKHLKHGKNAILVRPDDSTALSKAIEKIMLSPSNSTKIAQAAYKDVQVFTWNNRAKAILAHFYL